MYVCMFGELFDSSLLGSTSLSQIDYLSVLECQVLESGVKLDLLPALRSPNPGACVVYACEGH